ncbi:hypothetical protein LX69_03001 [Breznakibacter xylanolyticus]|uniref:Glycosyl transferase family 1 n=2 Tax=Breznakibacter xylanolyticus TaxID=990 RepID=A0A2W7N0I3_9BACT|nr:hypothetical protein LX69_03001 [Breznakibacter xylanolyticus]
MWFFSWTSLPLFFKHKILLKQRNIELILLNNSKREHLFAKIMGFKSFFINQNINVCEHQFRIKPAEKKYDAIYIAAAKQYKRIHLAKLIKRLYIVTYFWPDIRDKNGKWDLHKFEPAIKHADFNNERIDATEINKKLNESKCGLALSKKEGAMLAVMEYLYAGLPVVSTNSIGGRDLYLHPDYSIIVKDNPLAVLNGVNNIISRNINPDIIREKTLEIVEQGRKKFFNLCKELSSDNNEFPDYEQFKSKLWGSPIGLESNRII